MVVGLLLAAAGDGHNILQVLPHSLKQLHTKVDLTLEKSEHKIEYNQDTISVIVPHLYKGSLMFSTVLLSGVKDVGSRDSQLELEL